MKNPTTLFLALTLITTLLSAAAPAYATLTIQLDKETYAPGEFLSLTGSGAPANQPVSIQVIDPNGDIRGVAQVIADATGAFTATNFFKVPAEPTGTWTVKARVAGLTATDTFTTLVDTTPPTITSLALDKTIVKGGASITLTVEATDNIGVTSVKADAVTLTLVAGRWVGAITAAATEGVHTLTVEAADAAGNKATGTATYRVDNTPPTITHTPVTAATVNTPVTIRATVTDNVELRVVHLLYRVVGEVEYTTLTMAAVGAVYSATIPATAVTVKGVEYYIHALDTAANEARAPAVGAYSITVIAATLTVTPSHAAPGASVSFSGTNFTPNTPYTLTLDWSEITVTLASGTTTPAGAISGTFIVPAIQSQVYTITAKDRAGVTASAKFGVEQISTKELATKVDTLSTQLTNVEKTLSTKMDTLQATVTKAITDSQKAITAAISTAQADIKAAVATSQKAVTDAVASAQAALSGSVKSVDDSVKAAQADVKAAISTAQAALSRSVAEVKTSVDNINTGVATASTFTLITTALVVITLVLALVILIRRRA